MLEERAWSLALFQAYLFSSLAAALTHVGKESLSTDVWRISEFMQGIVNLFSSPAYTLPFGSLPIRPWLKYAGTNGAVLIRAKYPSWGSGKRH